MHLHQKDRDALRGRTGRKRSKLPYVLPGIGGDRFEFAGRPGQTLYGANSNPNQALWRACDVRDDGTLGEGRVFCDATPRVPSQKGLPDGMKVDRSGNLFATGPGGVLVFDPDGTHLGTLNTGVATANCGWGDDGSVLYITADRDLCRIRLTTRGY
jgi:gluconolactonase